MSKRSISSSALDAESSAPVQQRQKTEPELKVDDRGLSGWSREVTDKLFLHVLHRAEELEGKYDFKSFAEKKTEAGLLKLLRTTCADGCALLDSGCIRWRASLVKDLVDDDPYYNGDAWYLMKLLDHEDGDWYKLVVGQTNKYERRKSEYEQKARRTDDQKRQLLYHVWNAKESRFAKFGILGKMTNDYPGWDDEDYRLWKNFVEMFFTVGFQSLPCLFTATDKGTGWIPAWLPKCPEVGLQMGYPIHQTRGNEHRGETFNAHHMANSNDPEVAALFKAKLYAHLDRARENTMKGHWETGFDKTIRAHQNISPNKDVSWRFRDPNADPPEPSSVKNVCSACKVFIWIDHNPTFSVWGDGYVTKRNRQCLPCRNREKGYTTHFKPVDQSIKHLTLAQLDKKAKSMKATSTVDPPIVPAFEQAWKDYKPDRPDLSIYQLDKKANLVKSTCTVDLPIVPAFEQAWKDYKPDRPDLSVYQLDKKANLVKSTCTVDLPIVPAFEQAWKEFCDSRSAPPGTPADAFLSAAGSSHANIPTWD